MRFIDRVKEILLKKNEEELKGIEQKIKELEEVSLVEDENIRKLKQEATEVHSSTEEFQRNIMDKSRLKDLTIIYEFIANFPRIERIIEELKQAPLVPDCEPIPEKLFNRRSELNRILRKLNKELEWINDTDIEELRETNLQKEENTRDEEKEKASLFSKIFNRILGGNVNDNIGTIFDKFKKAINDYNNYYSEFLTTNLVENGLIIDEATIKQLKNDENYLLGLKKKGIVLVEADEIFLGTLQPREVWTEILRFYSNIKRISNIIGNFESEIDRFEKIYKEEPELFDLENLERILNENNQIIIDFKSRKKVETKKKNEYVKKKQGGEETKSQLEELRRKRADLVRKSEKIEKAKTLNDLGYKNKDDAVKKLSIDTKDYIIIPIPDDIEDILALFNNEKQIKVEIEGKTFSTTYLEDRATGRINSIEELEGINATLMIPINTLRKEDIDSIKSGKISISSSVLQNANIIAILPEGREINFGDSQVEIKRYSSGDINEQVETFLGDDYVNNSDEIENYDIFKKVPDVSQRSKKAKREAVKTCLFQNLKRDISHTETILVDGKSFYIYEQDERDLLSRSKTELLDEKKLGLLLEEIEDFLIEDGETSVKIDEFYQSLLFEYMRVNPKVKAEYYEESDTTIMLKGQRISIKPPLPAKDEEIVKRYSRPSEDIAYKTMKLANLVNRFAHEAEKQEKEVLKNELFQVKLDLIERIIDLSKENPKIKVRKSFDEEKKVMSIILEIPGYNVIALHIMNKSDSLVRKSNQLQEYENSVVQTSTILSSGVNRDLLLKMKTMSMEERYKLLVNLDSNTFYKLVLRMGYSSDTKVSEEEKREFIKSIISDEKISELLKEQDETER